MGIIIGELNQIGLTGATSNTTMVIPAGQQIISMVITNTTANAITGGLKVGTSSGATDVVVALAVGASALLSIPAASLLKNVFSSSVDTTLFIQAVVAWNSASVNISILTAPF